MEKIQTIETIDLTTGYRKGGKITEVTSHLSASLYSGEMTCLLGPNGSGKTTLLKTLAAMLPSLGGEIKIEGKTLREYSDRERAEKIGIVLTDKIASENTTVEDLVALGRSPYTGFFGKLTAEDHLIIKEAIRMVGIEDLKDRLVSGLSDGERQKAMIAKTLTQETPVIFLDEPTAFLDYPSKAEIMLLLRRLAHEEGKTVFISTHDLELALQIADKAWLLDKRLGLRIDTPAALSEKGEIGKYFNREGLRYDPSSRTFRVESE